MITVNKASIPLHAHQLFHSSDLDEARESVSRFFCPHRLEIIGKGQLNARHHHLSGRSISLNYVEYGTTVLIAPGELGDFYLVQIPIQGTAAVSHGNSKYYVNPNQGSVLNPHVPTTMIWDQGCKKILIQIQKSRLEQHFFDLFGFFPQQPICFSGSINFSNPKSRTLLELAFYLVNETDAGRLSIGSGSLLGFQFEAALMTALLENQPHNYSNLAAQKSEEKACPRAIRMAREIIESRLGDDISVNDIAKESGLNVRSLQSGFRLYVGKSPMAYMRDARLAKAHLDLVAAKPGDQITDIALRWGFNHLGRFSKFYKAHYGVTPRQTWKFTNERIYFS